MKIIPDLVNLAATNQLIADLAKKAGQLEKQLKADAFLDTRSLALTSASLVTGCEERDSHLYKDGEQLDTDGLVDDLYYRCNDGLPWGTLYFKTEAPDVFVTVPYNTRAVACIKATRDCAAKGW